MERAKGTESSTDNPKEYADPGKTSPEELAKFDAEQKAKREAETAAAKAKVEADAEAEKAKSVEAKPELTPVEKAGSFADYLENEIKLEIAEVRKALSAGRGQATAALQAHLHAIIAEGVKLVSSRK